MGAFEFRREPRQGIEPFGWQGADVEVRAIQMDDFNRLMRMAELVKRLEDALVVCSYVHPESEITKMVNEAAKLLKGAHE